MSVILASEGGRLGPLAIASVVAFVATHRPDVVHAWGAWSTLCAGLACRLLRIPLVDCSVRSARGPDRAWLFRANAALATAVVSNSDAGLTAWRVPHSKAVVIRNAFDSTRLQGLRHPEKTSGRTVVVMAARMIPGKDFATLLAAARQLLVEGFDVGFALVGDGPDRRAIDRQARDLIDAGVVNVRSGGTEAIAQIAAADIGVLLNDPVWHREGCSNSILEYMALGLPVVCTRAGGNPELIEDGVNGYLVRPGDVADVTARLRDLLADSSLRARMGEQGRLRIQADHTAQATIASTVALYERVLR